MSKIDDANRCFFGKWAGSYDCFIFSILKLMQKKAVAEAKAGKVLDVGCGTGYALEAVGNKFSDSKLYGIDLSKEMIAKAKERLGKNAVLKVAGADKLPFRENSFDCVLCTSAFHHFPSQLKALKEMKRVLKPHGRLVLFDEDFSVFNYLFKKFEPGYVKMNSKADLKGLFRKAGLMIVKQKRVFLFAILNVCHKN